MIDRQDPPARHPGAMETMALRATDPRRLESFAADQAPADSPNPVEWARGFVAAAKFFRQQAVDAARAADNMAEHALAVHRTCHPVASALSADHVKSYGSTLDQDAIADIVSKALGVDRGLLDWVETNGARELWIGMPSPQAAGR